MKRHVFIAGLFLVLAPASLFSSIGIQTKTEEIKDSFSEIEEAVKAGDESAVNVYFEALEILKRATTPVLAANIKRKILEETGISDSAFNEIRKNSSFFDISIGWAVSDVTGKSFQMVMESKKGKTWGDVFSRYFPGEREKATEKLSERIRTLDPRRS